MKTLGIKRSKSKISECRSFFSWLFFETDLPYIPKGEADWFRYLGSPHRVYFIRFFGREKETEYYEEQE